MRSVVPRPQRLAPAPVNRSPRLLVSVAAAATVGLLTACGNSTGGAPSVSAPTATGTAATPSRAAADTAFCDQARKIMTEVDSTVDLGSDQRVAHTLPTLTSQVAAVTAPPPAIAPDWQQVASAIQTLSQDYQGANLSDPQQLQQVQQKNKPAEVQLAAAGGRVEDFLGKHCG